MIPSTTVCRYLEISPSGQFLLLGMENGEVQIRSVDNLDKYMRIKMHDGQTGRITSLQMDRDEKLVVTTGEDGIMYVHQVDKDNIRKEAVFDPFADVENLEYIPEITKDEIRQQK